MLSLDFNYLFVNVPIKISLICLERHVRNWHYSDTEMKDYLFIIKLCTEHTPFLIQSFIFNLQTKDSAIGKPLCSILCDMYFQYFEVILLIKYNFKWSLRYMENTFVFFDKSYVLVNSTDPRISFIRKEVYNDFLHFKFSWYQGKIRIFHFSFR